MKIHFSEIKFRRICSFVINRRTIWLSKRHAVLTRKLANYATLDKPPPNYVSINSKYFQTKNMDEKGVYENEHHVNLSCVFTAGT
jgi:hypothetical protein